MNTERKFSDLTKKQVAFARRLADEYGETISQAAKYFEWLAAHKRGELSSADLHAQTGIKAPGFSPSPAPTQPAPVAPATQPAPVETAPQPVPTPAPQPATQTVPTTDIELVNLTPHPLNLRRADGSTSLHPPSGQIARVAETRETLGLLAGLSVTRASYGAVEGLPAPEAGRVYVVSALVLAAVQDRPDVFSPGPAIRDGEGKIVGADGLSATAAYVPTPTPRTPNDESNNLDVQAALAKKLAAFKAAVGPDVMTTLRHVGWSFQSAPPPVEAEIKCFQSSKLGRVWEFLAFGTYRYFVFDGPTPKFFPHGTDKAVIGDVGAFIEAQIPSSEEAVAMAVLVQDYKPNTAARRDAAVARYHDYIAPEKVVKYGGKVLLGIVNAPSWNEHILVHEKDGGGYIPYNEDGLHTWVTSAITPRTLRQHALVPVFEQVNEAADIISDTMAAFGYGGE